MKIDDLYRKDVKHNVLNKTVQNMLQQVPMSDYVFYRGMLDRYKRREEKFNNFRNMSESEQKAARKQDMRELQDMRSQLFEKLMQISQQNILNMKLKEKLEEVQNPLKKELEQMKRQISRKDALIQYEQTKKVQNPLKKKLEQMERQVQLKDARIQQAINVIREQRRKNAQVQLQMKKRHDSQVEQVKRQKSAQIQQENMRIKQQREKREQDLTRKILQMEKRHDDQVEQVKRSLQSQLQRQKNQYVQMTRQLSDRLREYRYKQREPQKIGDKLRRIREESKIKYVEVPKVQYVEVPKVQYVEVPKVQYVEVPVLSKIENKIPQPNEMMQQQGQINDLLSFGDIVLTMNEKEGMIFIGQRVSTTQGQFYTKKCIWIEKKDLKQIVDAFKMAINRYTKKKLIMSFSRGRLAWIIDQYKGKLYAGLRMIAWYYKKPISTKNGINLTVYQANELCVRINDYIQLI